MSETTIQKKLSHSLLEVGDYLSGAVPEFRKHRECQVFCVSVILSP